jgi:hypothetical protein
MPYGAYRFAIYALWGKPVHDETRRLPEQAVSLYWICNHSDYTSILPYVTSSENIKYGLGAEYLDPRAFGMAREQ